MAERAAGSSSIINQNVALIFRMLSDPSEALISKRSLGKYGQYPRSECPVVCTKQTGGILPPIRAQDGLRAWTRYEAAKDTEKPSLNKIKQVARAKCSACD